MYDALYLPILRAMAGELSALGHLSPHARVRVRPILDVPLPKTGESVSARFSELACETARTWGTREPIYFDLSRYGPELVGDDGRHVIAHLFRCGRQAGLRCLPVTGPVSIRGPGTAYTDAVADIVAHDRRGAALRLPPGDLLGSAAAIAFLSDAIAASGLTPSTTDLIVDASALDDLPEEDRTDRALLASLAEVVALVRPLGLRSVTFVSSSIPRSQPRKGNGEPCLARRVGLDVWRALPVQNERIPVLFGDYGIVHASQSDPTGPVRVPSRVRISTETVHHLYRAPSAEYRALAAKALESSVYSLQPESWGKSMLGAAARGGGAVGNPTDWIARDTNMHLEATARFVEAHLQRSGVFGALQVAEESPQPWLQSEIFQP